MGPLAATAGEAGYNDVEQADNAVDDGSEDCADAVDDSHQDGTDGSAYAFELLSRISFWIKSVDAGRHTQEMTAPMLRKVI